MIDDMPFCFLQFTCYPPCTNGAGICLVQALNGLDIIAITLGDSAKWPFQISVIAAGRYADSLA